MDIGDEPQSLKRRRVTRACDECRRKKIKCDGRLPCTHCTVYSYNCTFDQPSNRRRNPPTGYIEKLEHKCERYEQLFRRFLPDLDLEKEVEDINRVAIKHEPQSSPSESTPPSTDKSGDGSRATPSSSIVPCQGVKLNRDSDGNVDFRGNSSGTVFIQSVVGQLGMGGDDPTTIQDLYSSKSPHDRPPQESHKENEGSQKIPSLKTESSEVIEDIQLPDYDIALQLTRLCFDKACCIIQFVHEPSFYTKLTKCYESSDGSPTDENFLGVLYSALAVGCLFLGAIKGGLGIEEPKIRAFQYFQASKSLMDPLDRANTEILQTILCQILFLQSTGNMSTCWTYVGTALRCAQRMGLHKRVEDGFNPIERQLRCKMFWSIRNIELFLHTILGLPRGISDEDFDQALPLEVDDEFITVDGIQTQPEGRMSTVVSFNSYSRLMTIMADIVRLCFPLNNTAERTLRIANQGTIEALHTRLTHWVKELHPQLQFHKRYDELDLTTFRQSRLVRYTYYHAYLLLHRPYLHYLSSTDEQSKELRRYGLRARTAAIGVLQLTEEIFVNEPTCFGHWFSIYATFFAGMIVLYCIITERPARERAERAECLRYLEISKQAMALCSKCSYAAGRCHDLLDELAKQVPVQDSISQAASKTFNTVHKRGLSTSSQDKPSPRNNANEGAVGQPPNGIKKEHFGTSRKVKGSHSRNTSAQLSLSSAELASLNLSSGNYIDNREFQTASSRINAMPMPHGVFPMSPGTYGFQPSQIYPDVANMNLHTSDTYQPNMEQPSYQEYFSMLHQAGAAHQDDMYQFPAADLTNLNQYKPESFANPWPGYFDEQSQVQPVVENIGRYQNTMPSAQEAFMFPDYTHEQYAQPM